MGQCIAENNITHRERFESHVNVRLSGMHPSVFHKPHACAQAGAQPICSYLVRRAILSRFASYKAFMLVSLQLKLFALICVITTLTRADGQQEPAPLVEVNFYGTTCAACRR